MISNWNNYIPPHTNLYAFLRLFIFGKKMNLMEPYGDEKFRFLDTTDTLYVQYEDKRIKVTLPHVHMFCMDLAAIEKPLWVSIDQGLNQSIHWLINIFDHEFLSLFFKSIKFEYKILYREKNHMQIISTDLNGRLSLHFAHLVIEFIVVSINAEGGFYTTRSIQQQLRVHTHAHLSLSLSLSKGGGIPLNKQSGWPESASKLRWAHIRRKFWEHGEGLPIGGNRSFGEATIRPLGGRH